MFSLKSKCLNLLQMRQRTCDYKSSSSLASKPAAIDYECQTVELKIPLLFRQQSTFGKLSGMFGGFIRLKNVYRRMQQVCRFLTFDQWAANGFNFRQRLITTNKVTRMLAAVSKFARFDFALLSTLLSSGDKRLSFWVYPINLNLRCLRYLQSISSDCNTRQITGQTTSKTHHFILDNTETIGNGHAQSQH